MFGQDAEGDFDKLVEVVTAYLQFCQEMVVEEKEIKFLIIIKNGTLHM